MRIVIDVQAAQESVDRPEHAVRALAMAQDVARCARGHELWIVLNGALPGTIPALRAAFAPFAARERILAFTIPAPLAKNPERRACAQLLREHFITMLAPDRVLVAGLPQGDGDAVISVDTLAPGAPTVLLLLGATPPADAATQALMRRCALVLGATAALDQTMENAAPVDSGAQVLAALLAMAPRPPATPAIGRIGVVSRSPAIENRLASYGEIRRIDPDAGAAALDQLASWSELLLYHQDGATDTATLLAGMEAHPGALLLQSMAPAGTPGPQALFDAHGYPALVHGGAGFPANLALLQAASAVLFDDAALAAAARRFYGPEATRDWLPAGDDATLGAALAALCQPARHARAALLQRLAAQREVGLPELAFCLAQMPDPLAPRQLLVDVTAIVRHDLKTGIERVVRTQLLDLLRRTDTGMRVEPVYLSNRGGRWHYRYARAYAWSLLGLPEPAPADLEADVRAGDIFYGADYSPHTLAAAAGDGLFDYWRARGVAINFVVYDLLPVLKPAFFPDTAAHTQGAWLHAVARNADQLVCISAAVAADMARWLAGQHLPAPALQVLHLGADLDEPDAPSPARGLPVEVASAPTFLMVGTIEPRKGHLQAIAAFEMLWAAGVAVNLLVIGHEGWRGLPDAERRTIPEIARQLEHHPELGQRLFWLRGPSDAVLRQAYAECACLLAASEGEGFGLPLIEAARYGLPLLARDLPVFREVAREHARYFDGAAPADLAAALQEWLAAQARGDVVASGAMPWQTWHQNVDALLALLQESGASVPAGPDGGL